jgi:Mg-chelatase subunit ChlD
MNIETILRRPSVRGLEFRLGIEAFAHKICQSLGMTPVSVYWDAGVTTAGINLQGHLYLAGVLDEAVVSRAMVVKYAGYVVHELLHHKYTDFSAGRHSNQYIRTLHNAVEDGWIENTAINSVLLANVGPLLSELIDGMTREAIATVTDWNDSRQYPFILAVHCRKHATLKCPINPELAPVFDEAARRCMLAQSSMDTLVIAEWVYEQIKNLSKQTQEEKSDDKKSKSSKKDDTQDAQDGAASPSNDKPEGSAEGHAEKTSSAPSGPVQSPEDVVAANVEPELKDTGMWRSYSSNAVMKNERHHLSYDTIHGLKNVPVPARLRYEVRRLFENSGFCEFTRNRKAGVVNVHALPSVAVGSERVFKRRLDIEGVDSAVVICLDVSGSMFEERGTKHELPPLIGPAVQTCRALLETLDGAGVKTAVLCFGTVLSVPKGFDKNAKRASEMLGKVSSGGGTNDYAALRHAHQMLALRRENRKIVFVITDGQGKPNAVKQQVSSGKAMGITTVGVGIQFDVSDIYGQAVLVQDISDLGNASFKQIKLAV